MNRIVTFAAATAAFAATPLAAQEVAQQPAQAAPTQEQIQAAARHYSVIAGALQSEDLDTTIKNQLFMCLYSASVRQISDAVTQVIAQNEGLSGDNQEHVQTAIGAVCGVQAPEGAAATPAESGDAPVGR
jgi:hypothetical protein